MDQTYPPAKRPRLDDHAVSEVTSVVRSDLWHDDGNIILQAQNTHFKVHRSVLSNHSIVFKDMFGLCAAENAETVDHCPVVHVDDSADDLCHVLKTLYDWRYFRRTDLQPFSKISALSRLGRKYAFDDIRQEAVSLLEAEFPSSLHLFATAVGPLETNSGFIHIQAQEGLFFDAANLAREAGIEVILPFIFQTLAADTDQARVFDGDHREDGTIARCSPENVRAITLGRQRMFKDQYDRVYAWFMGSDWDTPSNCEDADACTAALRDNFHNYHHAFRDETRLLTPWDEDMVENMCDKCILTVKESFNANREVTWDKLPSYFDLPPWDVLKATARE